MKWELDDRGSTPSVMHNAAPENTPVGYPRSNADRALSDNNKGGASVTNGPGTVNYEVGPYPEAVIAPDDEADMEGSGTA
jgi:hypothetical protein